MPSSVPFDNIAIVSSRISIMTIERPIIDNKSDDEQITTACTADVPDANAGMSGKHAPTITAVMPTNLALRLRAVCEGLFWMSILLFASFDLLCWSASILFTSFVNGPHLESAVSGTPVAVTSPAIAPMRAVMDAIIMAVSFMRISVLGKWLSAQQAKDETVKTGHLAEKFISFYELHRDWRFKLADVKRAAQEMLRNEGNPPNMRHDLNELLRAVNVSLGLQESTYRGDSLEYVERPESVLPQGDSTLKQETLQRRSADSQEPMPT